MRKVIVSVFASMDGVQENPHEWSLVYATPEYESYARDQLFAADALLMGRVTYQGFAESWPSMSEEGPAPDDFTHRINTMQKYVVSTTLDEAGWTNSTLLKGDPAEAVRELRRQPGQDILMYGCGELARTLTRHDLVDEIRVWVHPVVLGRGESLFTGWDETRFCLAGTRTFASGVVVLAHTPIPAAEKDHRLP
ncbi:dihydrofolate reductase family protein [Nonomuraea sp. NPDC005650]|uniref:dihydrofolate reductase family protein n=1 Tax=Nonomuraea sp. NPDC005650 TaxID=3157045 RepID=UPI0033B23A16